MTSSLAMQDFEEALSRISRLLDLIREFHTFGASEASPDETGEEGTWPAATRLHSVARTVRTDLPIMAGAILLYATGRFEYFVRQRIEERADQLTGEAMLLSDLPPALVKAWRKNSLSIAQSPSRYSFDDVAVDKLLEDLVHSARGEEGSPTSIDSQVLTITESNMRPNVLNELLKIVGVDRFWEVAAKQLDLQAILEERDENKCTQVAKKRLDKIMEDRNRIAHPSGSMTFPSAQEVQSDLEYLRHVAKVVHQML